MSHNSEDSEDNQYPSSRRSNEDEHEDEELISQDEDEDDYCEGGYHPVNVGDVFINRFIVKKKLGWGAFSTVWACWDVEEEAMVAIKVFKSNEIAKNASLNEIELHIIIEKNCDEQKQRPVVHMYDFFEIEGVNGTHMCIAFELLGDSLLSLIKKSQFPVKHLKTITKQFLEAVAFLHQLNIIHADLKSDNVMFTINENIGEECKSDGRGGEEMAPVSIIGSFFNHLKNYATLSVMYLKETLFGPGPTQGKSKSEEVSEAPRELGMLKLVDIGNAVLVKNKPYGRIQVPPYRALEVVLEAEYDTSADIWSVACLIFQLATGDFLFKPYRSANFSGAESHLGLLVELLGNIPPELVRSGKRSNMYLKEDGGLKNESVMLSRKNLSEKLTQEYGWAPESAEEFSKFLLPMLELDPKNRATGRQSLEHAWLNA